MKANELMIGDIVRVAKEVCIPKGTVVSIKGIDADNRFGFAEKHLIGSATCLPINNVDRMTGGVWVEYLEPIPLTPDILEKNGFEVQDQGGGRKDLWTGFGIGCEGDIEVEFKDNIPIHLKIDGAFNGEYYTSTNITYTHQLQHALKVCKIDKEIKL